MAIEYEFVGIDGKVWKLTEPGTPAHLRDCPVRLRRTPTGLGGAPFKFDDLQNVDQPGVTFAGRMDDPNVIGLEYFVGPVPRGDEAEEVLRAWHASLGRGKPMRPGDPLAEFRTRYNGRTRRQQVRALPEGLGDPDYATMRDVGQVSGAVKLRSDESWWRRDPMVKTFTPAQFAGAKIRNDSDEAVWPHFVIHGPITLPKIGVAGEQIALPTIAAGDVWTIETDPDWFSITDGAGLDRSWVNRYWHTRAPARSDVPVTILGSGTSAATKVVVTLPQVFWAAL